jgi:hypothetical protein
MRVAFWSRYDSLTDLTDMIRCWSLLRSFICWYSFGVFNVFWTVGFHYPMLIKQHWRSTAKAECCWKLCLNALSPAWASQKTQHRGAHLGTNSTTGILSTSVNHPWNIESSGADLSSPKTWLPEACLRSKLHATGARKYGSLAVKTVQSWVFIPNSRWPRRSGWNNDR